MIRYFVAVPPPPFPLIEVRTGIKTGPERPGQDDNPGKPKTKTTGEIPEGILSEEGISQLPEVVQSIARKLCASDVCIVKSGLERVGDTTEVWASCTGQCLELDGNVPEQAIIETGLWLAANADLHQE